MHGANANSEPWLVGIPAETIFRELFVDNPMPMWLYDQESLRFVDVNKAAVQYYGYTREEFLSMTVADIRPPADVPRLQAMIRDTKGAQRSGFRRSSGWRHLRKDGSVIWVDIYSAAFSHAGSGVRLVIVQDITGTREAADSLALQDAYFSQLFHNSPQAIVMLDSADKVLDANRAFEEMFHYPLAEICNRPLNELIVPPDLVQEASAMSRSALDNGAPVARDTVRRRKDGKLLQVSVLGYPITVRERQAGIFAIYHDITESKRIATELAYQSTHDPLTGLINRNEFERRASARLKWSVRLKLGHVMLYMDLDQFKLINESCGHVAGDRLLVQVAELLRAHLRDSDSLARLGGDEFAVLINGIGLDEAAQIAERVVQAVKEVRFRWGTRVFTPSISIGVVELDGDTGTLSELMSAADTACYTAKERGRSRVQIFRADDQDFMRMRGELSWATRIMEAVENDRFALHYQRVLPVCAAQSAGSRYEILLRMLDTDGKLIPPNVFVPAAERYGLMPPVDRYVVRRVFRALRDRGARRSDFLDLVSINISGTSFNDENLDAYIKEQFEEFGLSPSNFCFEITETAAIANLSRALRFIAEMRELGCGIALDDFGSGMSSFNYLKSFNVDYLKIDGAFVRDMVNNPLDCVTVEAIQKVARAKGLMTVAEFVGSAETFSKLKELGVDYAQGYHLHKTEPWEPHHQGVFLP